MYKNSQVMINEEVIARFLEGRNQKKYIVGVEIPYGSQEVSLIINDPERGKFISKDTLTSFVWFKEEVTKIMYGGKRNLISNAVKKYGVSITKLKTSTPDQEFESKRMESGYKYMAKVKGSYTKLQNFFKEGGLDIYGEKHKNYFIAINPVEQYLIASGRRLFKGMDDYNDIHRLQFDLETTGLKPKGDLLSKEDIDDIKSRMGSGEDLTKLYVFDSNREPIRYKDDRIFQIGIKDNRGFEEIIEIPQEGTKEQLREYEAGAILKFFNIINTLKPDVIAGYNSENFDWHFIFTRCELLNIDIELIAKTLDKNGGSKIKRVDKSLKLGGEREYYKQTTMWGYNIVDVYHAVRRAKAINSNIKKAGLKYITKFSDLNKENRVYVEGNKIFETWADKETLYAYNKLDGTYYKISDETPLKDGYIEAKGADIVRQYLLDDLWETEQVDGVYNQASFLLSKIIPTSYMRSTTMGTAGIWKLIMLAWSYENRLAIPDLKPRKTFTGGLSRLLEVGYAKNVAKLDFAALYPNIEITHDIFPDTDITGVMKGMLIYIASTRDKFKNLMNEHKGELNKLKDFKEKNVDVLQPKDLELLNTQIEKETGLVSMYDKKQLPIKILGNSFFGSLGAPNIFNWGDINCAEETTCRGRQYLRLMVKFFMDYGFKPLVGDSVTFDTPIFIRWKKSKEIDILPISDLYNPKSESIDDEELRDYEIKPYEVLTVNGWKEINYVYRHETDKKIHRVSTKDKLICVTEDHSLFQNGKQIKPINLKRGDLLDVRNVENFNNEGIEYLDEELSYLYGYFLGDGSAIYGDRKQYYKSKKTGKTNVNKGKRSIFKISSSNYEKLLKLQLIIEEQFDVKTKIKDHRKSSGVFNLVSYSKHVSIKFSEDFYTSYREKKIPYYILNASDNNKLAFLNGVFSSDGYGDNLEECSDIGMKSQVAMSGIGYLMDCLNIDKKLKTRKDKENFISFRLKNKNRNNSSFTNKTKMKSNEVWLNEVIENRCSNNYVYDISTEDGTFVGGIGGVDLKNTDGFNFSIPDNVNVNTYIPKGSHRFTERDKGKKLEGLKAVVAEFNELYMIGRMGLDIDDICSSTINFSRKNYANLIDGKTKLVGNTIKSSKMPGYIEDFLDEGIKYLLNGDGESFIQLYNKTVDDIYNFRIPLVKIASKANVKDSVSSYLADMKTKTVAGNSKARKAHMELLLANNVKANLGDVVYYVNIGTTKSQGDVKKITNLTDEQKLEKKQTGKITGPIETSIELNCKLIPTEQIENNPNLTTDEYNVPKYLEAFNKRIHPLLVCFKPEIRDEILMDMVRKPKTKEMELSERKVFTKKECELDSGTAFKDGDQNSLSELMEMEDKEIEFWIRVNKTPNNLEELGMDWEIIQKDYHERMRVARIEGIRFEKSKTIEIIKRLELAEIQKMKKTTEIPKALSGLGEFTVHDDKDGNPNIFIKSKEWEVDLCCVTDILKYEPWAAQRQIWYQTQELKKDKTFEAWLTHLWVEARKNGEEQKALKIKKELELAGINLVLEDYKEVLENEKES